MDNAPPSDKSLLERLNALKPSSVSLVSPVLSKSDPAIERAGSPSRADALALRLKSLRNQESESVGSAVTNQDYGIGESTQPRPIGGTEPMARSKLGIQESLTTTRVTDDGDDSLLYADDQTLEDLLEDLRSDEAWLDEVAAEEAEHQRTIALLTELSKQDNTGSKLDGQYNGQGHSGDDGEESSDGGSEAMETEVESVLAKAMDEAEWEQAHQVPLSPQPIPTPPENAKGTLRDPHPQEPDSDSGSPDLPPVPSQLQDYPDTLMPSTQVQSDVDFAASIASRMAALKLSGVQELPSAPTVAVDSLGLPQAPTFIPADRPVAGLAKRTGFAGENQKDWCVVCLEDGAIRCIGCEAGDDIYCARCWKAMHVGPQAGYEERGHSWETFASRPR